MSIKFITGYSGNGGSTHAFIDIVNGLNNRGIDAILYGAIDFPKDKCKYSSISNLRMSGADIVVAHFFSMRFRLDAKKVLYSCHEAPFLKLNITDKTLYDGFHFVSKKQLAWHNVPKPPVIIPPIVKNIKYTNPNNNIAGVIGSVDKNKRTHLSIERALDQGFSKVLLFGNISDPVYFGSDVRKYVDSGEVELRPHTHKHDMYNAVSKVFHSSEVESYGLVAAECGVSGIPLDSTTGFTGEILSEDAIIEKWVEFTKC